MKSGKLLQVTWGRKWEGVISSSIFVVEHRDDLGEGMRKLFVKDELSLETWKRNLKLSHLGSLWCKKEEAKFFQSFKFLLLYP